MEKNSISLEEKREILRAVIDAEKSTSVEFQVHIDSICNGDVTQKASAIFKMLLMSKTKTKNWVLFYLSLGDHKYTIISDQGISNVIPAESWEEIKDHMQVKINEGNYTACLCEGIKMAGEKLKYFIPKQKDDINELPDEIVIGRDVKEFVEKKQYAC